MKMEGTLNASSQSSPGALASVFSVFTQPHRCGKLRCYDGAGFNVPLGKNRSEASSKLTSLWTSGWMGSSAHAVMLQFTLYSPVYNLFTTVTMLGEMPCMGAVLSSVFIYSTRLHHSTSALDYCTTAGELLLLLLSLLQLYFQTYVISQRGWRYWTDLWNWIEVIVVLLGVLCFVCSVHHFTLIADTMEHLGREDFESFVDLSPASSWEQRTHSLYGLLTFILLMKCCSLLCLNEAMTTAVSAVLVNFSSLLWPLITGAILVFAFSSLRNLFELPKSLYSDMMYGFGIGKLGDLHKNEASWMLCCYGALICTVSFAVKAMVTGILSSVVKKAKYKRKKHHLSVSELCTYIRDEALALLGKGRQKWTVRANSNNFVLEEFEDLVDELLLKINVIDSSDEDQDISEDQSPLQSAYGYRSEVGDKSKMEEMEIMPSVCCGYLYPHEEISRRSLFEWNTMQHFRRRGETIHDRALYANQKSHQNISTSPGKNLKDSQTSLGINQTVIVHTEGSETLKANRSQSFKVTREDDDCDNTIRNKAFSSKLPMGLISPTEVLKNHPSCRKSCRQICLYESHVEKREKLAEEEAVYIPGQCC